MSARTVETGFFGALGVSNPVATLSDINRGRSVNFKKTNAAENKTYPLIPIPAGMCITEIAVEQTEACDQDWNLTFGLASSDAIAVGGTFALTDDPTALLRSCQAAKITANATDYYVATSSAGSPTTKVNLPTTKEGLFVSASDMLCLVMPDSLTNDKIAKGKINVYVRGFMTFGESYTATPANTEDYRAKLQTQDNVSGGQLDPREFEG